jgi:hypothetical protein
MRKASRWLLAVAGLAVSVMVVAAAYTQEDMAYVKDSAFVVKTRAPVPFAHDEHNDNAGIEDCSICHHVYEDGQLVEGESSDDMECSECHMADAGSAPLDLVRVFHLNCKTCHLEQKAGPVQCAECHPK